MVRQALLLLPVLRVEAADPPPTGVLVDSIKYEFDPIGEYCLVPNYGPAVYTEATKLENTGTTTMEACAKLCTAESTCKSWTYVEETTGDHACWDVTPLAPPGAPGSVPLKYDGIAKPITGLAGVCSCPSSAKAGTILTGENFPAADPAKYADLFVASAHQPAPLGCWPKDDFGRLKLADPVVQRTNKVASTDPKYFAGWCDGMTLQDSLPAGMDCATACREEATCNGYQWVPDGSARPAGCFWGAGYDCDNEATGAAALPADGVAVAAVDEGMIAERFSRGYVTVVASITKYRVNGLLRRFDENAFKKNAEASDAEASASGAEASGDPVAERRLAVAQVTDWETTIVRCREICEADIWCSVWQVYDGSGTTADAGCWTETTGALGYPILRDVVEADATGVKDGAFIQHWFSEDITSTTTTTTAPPPPDRLLPILLGLAGLAALLGLGAYAMGWCSPKDKKKPRAKRALQPAPEPPKEEPRPEPVPTQPSFLMSAPVLTYTAAPITYAAPVATMQAAPMTYAAPPMTTASYQVVQPHSTMPYATSVVVPQEPIIGGFMG